MESVVRDMPSAAASLGAHYATGTPRCEGIMKIIFTKRKVYVGELTWLPQGGTGKIEPFEYEELYGNLLKLPELK